MCFPFFVVTDDEFLSLSSTKFASVHLEVHETEESPLFEGWNENVCVCRYVVGAEVAEQLVGHNDGCV